jgi:hypothetical protein
LRDEAQAPISSVRVGFRLSAIHALSIRGVKRTEVRVPLGCGRCLVVHDFEASGDRAPNQETVAIGAAPALQLADSASFVGIFIRPGVNVQLQAAEVGQDIVIQRGFKRHGVGFLAGKDPPERQQFVEGGLVAARGILIPQRFAERTAAKVRFLGSGMGLRGEELFDSGLASGAAAPLLLCLKIVVAVRSPRHSLQLVPVKPFGFVD